MATSTSSELVPTHIGPPPAPFQPAAGVISPSQPAPPPGYFQVAPPTTGILPFLPAAGYPIPNGPPLPPPGYAANNFQSTGPPPLQGSWNPPPIASPAPQHESAGVFVGTLPQVFKDAAKQFWNSDSVKDTKAALKHHADGLLGSRNSGSQAAQGMGQLPQVPQGQRPSLVKSLPGVVNSAYDTTKKVCQNPVVRAAGETAKKEAMELKNDVKSIAKKHGCWPFH